MNNGVDCLEDYKEKELRSRRASLTLITIHTIPFPKLGVNVVMNLKNDGAFGSVS